MSFETFATFLTVYLFALPFNGVLVWLATKLFKRARRTYRRRAEARKQIKSRVSQAWELAARRLPGAEVVDDRILVRIGAMMFRIEPVDTSARVRITTVGECGIPNDIAICNREAGSFDAATVAAGEVRTGDPDFDARLQLRGNPTTLLALLDLDMRRQLVLHAAQDDIRIESGAIVWTSGKAALNSRDLIRRTERVRELAEQLRDVARDSPRRLARIGVTDRVADVRVTCLRVLNERFPESREARDANSKALHDKAPEVRLMAASYSGVEGQAVLSRLAAWGGRVVSRIRVQALRQFVKSAPRATAKQMIDDLLDHGAGRRRRAAVAECGRIRHVAALPKLIAFLRSHDSALAAEAAGALAEIADPSTEPVLIDALRSGREVVVVAAARALGRMGTVGAIAALRGVTESTPADASECLAAKAAINTISERLDIARGQILISDEASREGALSITEDLSGGAFSVSDDAPAADKSPGRIREH